MSATQSTAMTQGAQQLSSVLKDKEQVGVALAIAILYDNPQEVVNGIVKLAREGCLLTQVLSDNFLIDEQAAAVRRRVNHLPSKAEFLLDALDSSPCRSNSIGGSAQPALAEIIRNR